VGEPPERGPPQPPWPAAGGQPQTRPAWPAQRGPLAWGRLHCPRPAPGWQPRTPACAAAAGAARPSPRTRAHRPRPAALCRRAHPAPSKCTVLCMSSCTGHRRSACTPMWSTAQNSTKGVQWSLRRAAAPSLLEDCSAYMHVPHYSILHSEALWQLQPANINTRHFYKHRKAPAGLGTPPVLARRAAAPPPGLAPGSGASAPDA